MEIEIANVIIGLIALGLCLLPFFLSFSNKRKKERLYHQSLSQMAEKYQSSLGSIEFMNHNAIAFDSTQNLLFFYRKVKEKLMEQSIDLKEYRNCQLINQSRKFKHKDGVEKVIDKLELSFRPIDPNLPEQRLEFYNAEDGLLFYNELDLAEKWSKLNQSATLKIKPKMKALQEYPQGFLVKEKGVAISKYRVWGLDPMSGFRTSFSLLRFMFHVSEIGVCLACRAPPRAVAEAMTQAPDRRAGSLPLTPHEIEHSSFRGRLTSRFYHYLRFMKTPQWATVVGVCLMVFGGCSISKNVQSLYISDMAEMQEQMSEAFKFDPPTIVISDSSQSASDSLASELDSLVSNTNKLREEQESARQMAEGFGEMFKVSDYAKKWTIRFAWFGLIISFFYILSGAFLLMVRSFSIKLVITALIVSMAFSLTETLVLTSDPDTGFIAKASGFGNLFGVIIDLVLLIVVLAVDKEAYYQKLELKSKD